MLMPGGLTAPAAAGLVSYRPRPKEKTGVNLLSGEGIPVTEVGAMHASGRSDWLA